MLGDPQECREQAAQCRALAAHAPGAVLRRAYLGVAEKWEALAHEIEQAKMLVMAVNMASPKRASESSPKGSGQSVEPGQPHKKSAQPLSEVRRSKSH